MRRTSSTSKRSGKVNRGNKSRWTCRPTLEALEHRVVPVINSASSFPATIGAGLGFDGVIQLTNATGSCSGTLLGTGRHILTAAHCVDNNVNGGVLPGNHTVQFDMFGRAISLLVPAANITVHGQWDGIANTGSDIAIMRLTKWRPSPPKSDSFIGTRKKSPRVGTSPF